MKKFLMMMFTMLMGLQSVQAMNVDEFIDKNIAPFTDAIANFVFSSVTLCGTKVPVIIFHGTEDKLVPVYMANELHAINPEINKLVIIEKAGHCLGYLFEPELYLKSMKEFFNE